MSHFKKTANITPRRLLGRPRRQNPHFARITRYIQVYWELHGYSPSIIEIETETALSRTYLYELLQQLRDRGELCFEDRLARTFRLPNQRTVFD